MKICAIICEYNPFHNGHLHQIQTIRALFPDHAILCIMSGNFVQRGEPAIMDKYTRAKHAVLSGANAVIELPTVFATSNAELFAKGAVHILSSIPDVNVLCFGSEIADKEQFLRAAKLLNNEPNSVSEKIKSLMENGNSYAKAYVEAWSELLPIDLLRAPNNILGLEYTKAILTANAQIDIAPIPRVGNDYNDLQLNDHFSSATAIRAAIENGTPLGNTLPNYVKNDLPDHLENLLDALEKYAILSKSPEEIARVCDCTEGLENALKKAALSSSPLVDSLTSTRYTSSRIRRIALQNMLSIQEELIRACLQSPLYIKVLAVKKDSQAILTALHYSTFPLLVRAHDEDALANIAKECYQRDIYAEKVYPLFYPRITEKQIFIV